MSIADVINLTESHLIFDGVFGQTHNDMRVIELARSAGMTGLLSYGELETLSEIESIGWYVEEATNYLNDAIRAYGVDGRMETTVSLSQQTRTRTSLTL